MKSACSEAVEEIHNFLTTTGHFHPAQTPEGAFPLSQFSSLTRPESICVWPSWELLQEPKRMSKRSQPDFLWKPSAQTLQEPDGVLTRREGAREKRKARFCWLTWLLVVMRLCRPPSRWTRAELPRVAAPRMDQSDAFLSPNRFPWVHDRENTWDNSRGLWNHTRRVWPLESTCGPAEQPADLASQITCTQKWRSPKKQQCSVFGFFGFKKLWENFKILTFERQVSDPLFNSYFRIFLFFITTISNIGQRACSKKNQKKQRKRVSSRTLELGSELRRSFNSKGSCQAPVCCSASQVAHMMFKPHGCDPTI